MKNLSLQPKANHALVCLLVLAVSVCAQSKPKMRHAHSSEATDPAFSNAFLGFHSCDALEADYMQAWWENSPFYAAGIYIGGVNRTCRNVVLTSSWVSAVKTQGWGLIPLWVGPQAPCTTSKHKILKDDAELQGEREAGDAVSAAESLGLDGTIIYYDMENYTPDGDDGTCGPIVVKFLSGWTNTLQEKGFSSGVYGSPTDAQSNFTKVSPLPDDAWFAGPYSLADVTIWSLEPMCDPFTVPKCSYWSDGQRIHHYGTAASKKEWGGMYFPCKKKNKSDCIDWDVIDGDFADSSQFREDRKASILSEDKTYTFEYKTIPLPSNYGVGSGINNAGQVVGSYHPQKGGYVYPSVGFLYSNGVVTSFSYHDKACPKVVCNTLGSGINNSGEVVGEADNYDTGVCLGLLYFKGSLTPFSVGNYACTEPSGINDAGQVVGTYSDASGDNVGSFLYDINTGVTTILPQSGYPAWGINGDALILMANSLYDRVTGAFTSLSFQSEPIALNNSLEMVGFCSCVYDRDGNEFPINYPGASSTGTRGLNDLTQVVGSYSTSNDDSYAFVATPKTAAHEQEVLLTQPTYKR